MDAAITRRGLLPEPDPATHFPHDSELAPLDRLGSDLPSLLQDTGFRQFVRGLTLPSWRDDLITAENLPYLRLYYVRLGFLASAYVNQVGAGAGDAPAARTSRCRSATSARGWSGRRSSATTATPCTTGSGSTPPARSRWATSTRSRTSSISTTSTGSSWSTSRSRPWRPTSARGDPRSAPRRRSADDRTRRCGGSSPGGLGAGGGARGGSPRRWTRRSTTRRSAPTSASSRGWSTRAWTGQPMNFRGETGAQSSIMPTLVALAEDPAPPVDADRPPGRHAAVHAGGAPGLARTRSRRCPPVKPLADKAIFNDVLEAMASFREVHYGWAELYIHRHVHDPRGTGGTPYRRWLQQLIEETRAHKIG